MSMSFFARRGPARRMSGFNFTERMRLTLARARDESRRLRHEYVGTEHLLLALLRDDGSIPAAALARLDVDRARVIAMIEETVKPGHAAPSASGELPYTSRAKKSLELAMQAARELNHTYVGTEHLILGLLDEERGIAAQVLVAAGVQRDRLAAEIVHLLGPMLSSAEPPEATQRVVAHEPTPQDIAREELAWRRLSHALDATQRLGATPTLELGDDGTLVVSLGAELVVRVAFPPTVGLARRTNDMHDTSD